MALHKDLTGADLHEPKGIASAPVKSVYVADGAGSGTWTGQFAGAKILNEYWLSSYMQDISTLNNSAFFYVPIQSELFEIDAITTAILTTANSIVSIYVNGVLFPDTLTVLFTGSSVGMSTQKAITTVSTIAAGSVIEVRSNGGSDTTSPTYFTLGLRAK